MAGLPAVYKAEVSGGYINQKPKLMSYMIFFYFDL